MTSPRGGDWMIASSQGRRLECLWRKSECLIVILKRRYIIIIYRNQLYSATRYYCDYVANMSSDPPQLYIILQFTFVKVISLKNVISKNTYYKQIQWRPN